MTALLLSYYILSTMQTAVKGLTIKEAASSNEKSSEMGIHKLESVTQYSANVPPYL
jgi:hypothetical protein